MKQCIGIRKEDKYLMEKRVAIIPQHIQELTKQGAIFKIEESPKRVFTAKEYTAAGAEIVQDVSDCDLIFGVKEMPIDFFKENKTYVFFSHVIKGQAYNMPMLRRMMEKKCNLIEYEKIADEKGKRLIFFGRYAGLAGMINSLWTVGQRLKIKGISNPFETMKQSHLYHSLEEAKEAVSKVGHEIAINGLPDMLKPFVVGITGYGNVAMGAQEILHLLPVQEISPKDLNTLSAQNKLASNLLYKVVFKESDLSERIDGSEFILQDYYMHPEDFKSKFNDYLPQLSLLMNCMYWDARYPRILTRDWLKEAYADGNEPKLIAVGDVTCDPDGSVEATVKGTYIEDPVFVYDPFTAKIKSGFDGKGLQIMAVDILPSELPREASTAFSDALLPFLPEIIQADYSQSFTDLKIPAPIKRAMILHHGQLTPDYKYLEEYI